MSPSPRRPGHVRVTYRKMAFDFEARGFDKRWHSDSAFISYFWGALSMAFPAGEKFFVDAVAALQDQIEDPALREEVAEFIRLPSRFSYLANKRCAHDRQLAENQCALHRARQHLVARGLRYGSHCDRTHTRVVSPPEIPQVNEAGHCASSTQASTQRSRSG